MKIYSIIQVIQVIKISFGVYQLSVPRQVTFYNALLYYTPNYMFQLFKSVWFSNHQDCFFFTLKILILLICPLLQNLAHVKL